MSDVRFKNEIAQLGRLRELLAKDRQLTLRLDLTPTSLTWREFKIGISGLSALAIDGGGWSHAKKFQVRVQVPADYPHGAPPFFKFEQPVPFHPHIWSGGNICWGTQQRPQPNLMLVDWVRALIDYLQFGQDANVQINRHSPANSAALAWYESHQTRLSEYVPRIDMERLRAWIERARI